MPTTRVPGTSVQIHNDNRAFHDKVAELVRQFSTLSLGRELLQEIQMKEVTIVPAREAGNRTRGGGSQIFYRLRAGLRNTEPPVVQEELRMSMMRAASAGFTLQKISETLANTMPPTTFRTAGNLKQPSGGPPIAVRAARAAEIAALIQSVMSGTQPMGRILEAPHGVHSVGDHLLRFLHPYLTPGTGSNSTMEFNPDQEMACMGDKMKKRPPTIGLAHEMCHAWRNAVGRRLFDDAASCDLPDDEIMTTGFPPYQYEKFTENAFRLQWPQALSLRVSYR